MTRLAIMSRVFAPYSAMWGAAAWAFSASTEADFSTTKKASGPRAV